MATTMLRKSGLRAVAPAAISRRSFIVRASDAPTPETPSTAAPVAEVPITKVASTSAPATPSIAMAFAKPVVSFGDAMAFANPVGPETINGRLAMLGVTAAIGAEIASGQSIFTQFQEAAPVVLATGVLFAVASLVPMLRGADPKAAFGPFTQTAEMINGRAAMLGIAALIIVELSKGSALF